jgi:hypothetical protein
MPHISALPASNASKFRVKHCFHPVRPGDAFSLTVMSFHGFGELQRSNDKLETISQILRRHMYGDMMHDAINANL